MKLRINKLISDAGLGSRRDVEEYIKRGRVKINGRVAHLGDMVSEEDTVFFDEVDLPVKEPRTARGIRLVPRAGLMMSPSWMSIYFAIGIVADVVHSAPRSPLYVREDARITTGRISPASSSFN